MYSENHVINDVVLTVINDGDGTQCGMTYAQRCAAATGPLDPYVNAAGTYGDTLSPPAGLFECLDAAYIIRDYYVDHSADSV